MTTTIAPDDAERLLDDLALLAALAARAILAKPVAEWAQRVKPGGSPVTGADEAAEAVIVDGLRRLLPDVPVVAEEATGKGGAVTLAPTFMLIDPLDGTKEFLAGRNEYTVNIAIVTDGVPIAGVLAAPARGRLWRGANGRAERADMTDLSTWVRIKTRPWPDHRAVAAVSRSHRDTATDDYLAHYPSISQETLGSAVKFCNLAQGDADIYPRLSPTSEWDIAAGHALVVAAGGAITAPNGSPVLYGQPGFIIPGFIAWGDPTKAKPPPR